ncbi:MAG TPA: GNAT family N-acetyltransferase [Candidatus Saccharimonadales bacterium]|nr:GNAT family N-acetyltransferase [Candidatus Saccharimonadales bacterium]
MPKPEDIVLTGVMTRHDGAWLDVTNDRHMPQLDETFVGEQPWSADEFEWFLQRCGPRMVVAVLGETVVGSGVLTPIREQHRKATAGYIGGIIADEAVRGRGVGVAVMGQLDQVAIDQGLPSVALNTEEPRQVAIAMYRKLGYVEVPGTRGHYAKELSPDMETRAVPGEVLSGYFGDANTVSGPLGEGLINRTFLTKTWTDEGVKTSVLQRINPAFGPELVVDNAMVSDMLAEDGWEVAETLPPVDGGLFFRDSAGRIWRQLRYIESDGQIPENLTSETLRGVGGLLGRLHNTLAKRDYQPTFSIPHFHDTSHYAGRLQDLHMQLPSPESAGLATDLLKAYQALPELPAKEQLIHGDPQLTNILFRDEKPYTYIDFDTTMKGTIWMDIGDLLRATFEDDLKAGRQPDVSKLRPIIEGYYAEARPEVDADEFYDQALTATQLIALELGMRFVNDIADDNYFGWDKARFANRHDNHMWRAGIQWQIYQTVSEMKGA